VNHGRPFSSIAEAQAYVRDELADLSSYWRVYLYDATGARAMAGTRSNVGGGTANGKQFIWEGTQTS
jgi:hypothetical protein